MARSQIDPKRMRYILEVARAEAISTAAETLGVTQSALSRSIADVESALGLQLFHRLPRGIQLTQAGQRFVVGAQRVLSDIENLVAHVRETRDLVGGRLRIGFAPSGYISHARRALQDFSRLHPAVSIDVVTGTTQTLCPRLLAGEFDLMVGSSSYLRRWRDLEITPLTRMHFACMVRLDHPLVAPNGPLGEIDVLRYPFILPRSVEPMYSDIAQRFAHHGLPAFQPRYTVDDFNTILRIVRVTDAIYPFMSPDQRTFEELREYVALLDDLIEIPPHYISIAHATTRPKSAAAERFGCLMAQRLPASAT